MDDSIPGSRKSAFEWKTLSVVGAATWLVTSQLTGCSAERAEGEGEGPAEVVAAQSAAVAAGEGAEGEGVEGEGAEGEGAEGEGAEGEGERAGGEGAEGEGAEGEGAEGEAADGEAAEGEGEGSVTGGANLASDDVAYLTQLALIRGHLRVGHALYEQGLPALAETHMKHPGAEIYSSLLPAFVARGCVGFADGLTTLTAAVTARAELVEVTAAYEELLRSVRECEAPAALDDPAVAAKVIENLLRTAGVEYRLGVVDGQIDNAHEYQDAWGFTQVAMDYARSPAFASSAEATAVASQLQDLIAGLAGLWPSLDPEGPIEGSAAQLFGAAGSVEVAALGLRP